MIQSNTWDSEFLKLFSKCSDLYRTGESDFTKYYSEDDLEFLDTIGYQQREFFDFVEDYGDDEVPTPETALLIAAVRRDFLMVVQNGGKSSERLLPEQLPSKDSELDGFVWLPRIIAKARAKLRGELDPEIMYSCGGDRAFLGRHQIHAADFLRAVWAAEAEDDKIAAFVRERTPQS